MLAALFDAPTIEDAHAKGRTELEATAESLRVAILNVEPMALLGYLWGQLLMSQLHKGEAAGVPQSDLETSVLALEYVHAVLSGHAENTGSSKDEEALTAVLIAAKKLRDVILRYCLVAAGAMPGALDHETRTLAMHSMTSWTMLRGHRYQALEEEFFAFVLAPHDDALLETYGVGAAEIARGLQAAVDATRYGHMGAMEQIHAEMEKTYAVAENEGISLEEAIATVYATEEDKKAVHSATQDLFFGGICDVGKTSGLPAALLDDLSYKRGEEGLFFADGPLRGTPIRRLPARERPLLRLDGSYYACDPNFLRDSAYRAIQWGLGRRLPGYETTKWGERQAKVTESAFPHILATQLKGATVLSTVYYPDPVSGKWVENDLVVLVNDALLQIEVKAGVMPMHSPEMHFDKHVRTVQALVVKAKQQSERFFRYAASAPEVPLYKLEDGKYVEVHRLRLAQYRLAIPLGLTVEAFTPFSSMSKRLPEMAPILGKYPFVSMSVDDLFVLTRMLPTTGELLHYLSVRQRVAAQHDVALIDELDHLGSYLTQNRVDMFNDEHFAEGATFLTHAGASDVVDEYFADPDWREKKPPHQKYPPLLRKALDSIDVTRGPRFLRADCLVRDFSSQARNEVEEKLSMFLPTLKEYPYRWALIGGDASMLVWVQRSRYVDFQGLLLAKAESAALALETTSCEVLVLYVREDGEFDGGWGADVPAPTSEHVRYVQRLEDGRKMLGRAVPIVPQGRTLL